MKNLIIILSILLLISCKEKPNQAQPKLPQTIVKPFSLDTQGLNLYDNGIVRGSDNHEYLITNNGSHSQNVEHYIDCELCKSRKIQ